jgi:hypothetical protein
MGNPNRNRARGPKEKPALELTSYQLVMAICALLLLMCVLFIAGILVQRYSENGNAADQIAGNTSEPVEGAVSSASSAVRKTEGEQVAPRPVVLPPDSEKPSASTAGSSKERGEGTVKYIPAPPPRRDRPRQEAEAPVASDEAPAKPVPEVKEVIPVTEPATPAVPEKPETPITPVTEPEQPAVPSPTETDQTPPSTAEMQPESDAAAPTGPYTIQVASFDSNNLERAKQFKTENEAESKLTVNLVPSSDGKHIRAFVGEYNDRASADKARDEMRKLKGFEDCFVKCIGED